MSTRSHAKTSRIVGLALTTALATTALSGCTGKSEPTSNYSAAQAEVALKKGKVGSAIVHAEAAVLAAPRDAYARTLLGNAYLEQGRFVSAATTLAEAVSLGDNAPRTIVSLALAQIGAGDLDGAADTLAAHESALDRADYGLALALAGRADQGVQVLSQALRSGSNTPKIRQNLAYAYALAGDWRSARLMAAEDVPADQVGDRMAEWAALVSAPHPVMRVASLIEVTPVADSGQPVALALSNFPEDGSRLAAAEPVETAPVSDSVDAAPAFALASELPAATTATAVPADSGDVALASAAISDGPRFVSREVAQPVPTAQREASFQQAFAPVKRPAPAPAPAPSLARVDIARGDHAVQLGAFASMSGAQDAWKQFQRRYPELQGAEKIITKARVGGKIYYRVAAAGFARASARELCSTVKGRGGACIAYAQARPLPGGVSAKDRAVRVAAR